MSNTQNGENVSEQMLIDMSNQMKEKFEKNEKEMECLKKANLKTECEMMTWFGLITSIDAMLDYSCPVEIRTLFEVLESRAENWVKSRLTTTESDPVYFRQAGRLNIEIIDVQDNNNNN